MCVWIVPDCWNTGICFWPVPIKIWFNFNYQLSRCPSNAAGQAFTDTLVWGKEAELKRRNSAYVSLLDMKFPRITPNLDTLHTSFIRCCGFGCLCLHGIFPCWPSIWRRSQNQTARISGYSALPGRWMDWMESSQLKKDPLWTLKKKKTHPSLKIHDNAL